MAPAFAEADLIFSNRSQFSNVSALPTLSQLRSDLKRSNLSIGNRLRSIRKDSLFVEAVAAAYGRPLVANERCGSWYVDPRPRPNSDEDGESVRGPEQGTDADAAEASGVRTEETGNPARKSRGGHFSAYFKSTDGHTGQWKFSTRRLNLHLLEVIGKHDGCIIVDSTRRGMPDALSKTIPIWCAVLNRVLFPSHTAQHTLHLPPSVISASEHSQIEALLPSLADSLTRINLDLTTLRGHLTKPLRPLWVTTETPLPEPSGTLEIFEDFHPVICCTASRRISSSSELGAGGYIQGAADDTENWARGFTADLFWANIEKLLSTPEGDLPDLVDTLVATTGNFASDNAESRGTAARINVPPATQLTRYLSVGVIGARRHRDSLCEIVLLPEARTVAKCQAGESDGKSASGDSSPRRIEIAVGRGKIASRNLRRELATICKFAGEYLQRPDDTGGPDPKHITITCESGKDLSVGVALALFCHCFDDEGNIISLAQQAQLPPWNKDTIRTRLGKIMTAMPGANPSRPTLQSVNSFLMDWHT